MILLEHCDSGFRTGFGVCWFGCPGKHGSELPFWGHHPNQRVTIIARIKRYKHGAEAAHRGTGLGESSSPAGRCALENPRPDFSFQARPREGAGLRVPGARPPAACGALGVARPVSSLFAFAEQSKESRLSPPPP